MKLSSLNTQFSTLQQQLNTPTKVVVHNRVTFITTEAWYKRGEVSMQSVSVVDSHRIPHVDITAPAMVFKPMRKVTHFPLRKCVLGENLLL